VFAGRDTAVMAADAGTDDLSMVNREYGCEDVGVMAVLADIAGRDVREVFTRCVNTVVAVDTIARNVQVIKVGRQPRYA